MRADANSRRMVLSKGLCIKVTASIGAKLIRNIRQLTSGWAGEDVIKL